jgi:hypothetical protein
MSNYFSKMWKSVNTNALFNKRDNHFDMVRRCNFHQHNVSEARSRYVIKYQRRTFLTQVGPLDTANPGVRLCRNIPSWHLIMQILIFRKVVFEKLSSRWSAISQMFTMSVATRRSQHRWASCLTFSMYCVNCCNNTAYAQQNGIMSQNCDL